MSLLNSLFSGVSGLRNHQTMMDVIGDNIANVNSLGYKNSRVTFSDTFSQFVRYGSNPTNSGGGTNTFQVGLGMKVNSIDRNWNQGTFERTGIYTDLALQGPGMFILEKNGERFYSRAGAFIFDAKGMLVSAQNGAFVQGKMATEEGIIPPGNNLENIIIDPAMKLPAVATSNIKWGGNLSSSSSITRSEKYLQSGNIDSGLANGESVSEDNVIYDTFGNEYTFTTTYTKTGTDAYNLTYELKDSSGTVVLSSPAPITVTFDPNDNGKMVTMNGATPAPVQIQNSQLGIDFSYDPTTVKQTANTTTISSAVDQNRKPTIVTGTLTVYDSLGSPHTLTLKFTKTSANNWNWKATFPSDSGALSGNLGTITFNSDGSINTMSPNPPVLNFVPNGGASAQNIQLDFGSAFSGVTQTSSNSVLSALSQDGSASATLSNLSIDQYGHLVGVFSNGESRNLAQIMVANFTNLNGLINAGDNLYSVSANSGEATIGAPGEETRTNIHSGALEQSNVDLSEEFTRMIVSQRGFQASARIITVADDLLQEITNLVR